MADADTTNASPTGSFDHLARLWPTLDWSGRAFLARLAARCLGGSVPATGAGQLADLGAAWSRIAPDDRVVAGVACEAMTYRSVIEGTLDGNDIDEALARLHSLGLTAPTAP